MKKFKKLIYITIFFVIFAMAGYINASSVGDINGDGKINSTDMALAYERGNNDTATVHDLLRGDINNNNKLDESDIGYITNLYMSNSTLKDISLKLYINERYDLAKSTGSGSLYQYSTSNGTVASIGSNGILTGLSKGKSNIVVKSSDNTSTTINLDVSSDKIFPSKITLNKSNLSFDLSDSTNTSYTLICNINPSNANIGNNIKWVTSNSNVAKVDQNGRVTAYKNGNCSIVATNENGLKAVCSVKVQTSPSSINMNSTNQTIYLKGKNTTQLKTTYTPSNANINKDITWTSSNPSIASVDGNGLVKAVNIGTCKITAKTQNGKTCVCDITVEKIDPEVDSPPTVSITNDKNSNVIKAGDKVVYTIKINDENIKTIDRSKISISCSGDGYSDTTLSDTRISTSSSPTKNKITKIDYTKNEITLEVQTEEGVNNVGHLNICIAEGLAVDTNGNKNKEVVLNNYVASLNTSTALDGTEGYAACVVGVGNSFYVKSYNYYLDNQLKVSGRTTNEYIYTGLKSNTEYTIKVNIDFYTGKSSDDVKSGTIEEKIIPSISNGCETYFLDATESPSAGNDVGAADAILIKTKGGKTILIDSGYHANKKSDGTDNASNTRNGGDVINSFLNQNPGIVTNKTIDYFILTHPDSDHIGGFKKLTETYNYKFNNIVVSCVSLQYSKRSSLKQLDDLISYAKKYSNLISVTAGNCIKVDNCIFNIFNPYPLSDVPSEFLQTKSVMNTENGNKMGIRQGVYALDNKAINSGGNVYLVKNNYFTQSNENNQSIVTKLICGTKKMLLMGDAGFPTEEILLGKVKDEIANYDGDTTFTETQSDSEGGYVNKNGNNMFGYKTSKNGVNPGLGISWSNSYAKNDTMQIMTYMNLIKDIIVNENISISTLNSKYKLSRLTKKDISAEVLKKGHHGIGNTTSYSFLTEVKPDKIITTGAGKYGSSLCKYLDYASDYRIRKYYATSSSGASEKEYFQQIVNDGKGNGKYGLQNHIHNENGKLYYKTNWFCYVYGPSSKMNNNYIKLIIQDGTEWLNFGGSASKIHSLYYPNCRE